MYQNKWPKARQVNPTAPRNDPPPIFAKNFPKPKNKPPVPTNNQPAPPAPNNPPPAPANNPPAPRNNPPPPASNPPPPARSNPPPPANNPPPPANNPPPPATKPQPPAPRNNPPPPANNAPPPANNRQPPATKPPPPVNNPPPPAPVNNQPPPPVTTRPPPPSAPSQQGGSQLPAPPPNVNADDTDVSQLTEDEKHYLASWYVQTKDRMQYPKAKAVIAAHRFKNLIAKPEPLNEAPPSPIPVAKPRRPPPDSPPFPPPTRLPYIYPEPDLPTRWENKDIYNDDTEKTQEWQRDFALRFLNKSWGDPYFARDVMQNVNEKMRERQMRIARNKRQIHDMQRDQELMKDYIYKLEEQNTNLKSSYIRGVPLEPEPEPPIMFQNLPYAERRVLEQKKGLLDDYSGLKEKQRVDRAVLEDYSRRLGGHLHRPDIEAIRRYVPSNHRYDNIQMTRQFDDLKERYYMLYETVNNQEIALTSLEKKMKANDIDSLKKLEKLAKEHEKETILFNRNTKKFMDMNKHDPILDYYQNHRSMLEDPHFDVARDVQFTEDYRRSKLWTDVDKLKDDIAKYRQNIHTK